MAYKTRKKILQLRCDKAWLLCALVTLSVPQALAETPDVRNDSRYNLHIPLTDTERDYLASLPTLRVGMDPNWPPYAFVNAHGQPDGISADYLNYLVQSLHLTVRRVASNSWDDTIRLANSGQLDMLVAMSDTDHASISFLPSQSFIEYPEVIVTRQNAKPATSLRDLDGLRVAMIWDGVAGAAPGMTTSIAFERMVVESSPEGMQAVADGKADAFIDNLGVVERLIRKRYAGVLHISGATGYSQSLTFAVAPSHEPLRTLINRVLTAIPEQDRERIRNTWLSTSLKYGVARRTLWEVLIPIGIVILISILILGFIIAHLRKEVRQRHAAEKDLLEASRVKDVFLATMSHEIRTPMSGMIGVLDLMDSANLDESERHLLEMARSASRTLLRILNDVLDFSKSRSGELTIDRQPFSLREVVDNVAGLFMPDMQRKGLQFDVFVGALVAQGFLGDGQRVGQVLLNLVGNSLKFTDRGCVTITVDAQPIDTASQVQHLTITVRDTGMGIRAAEQTRLFEPFVQVGTRHQGGTGLGLAICKRLIGAMGGDIKLHSEVGKGTRVELGLTLLVNVHAGDAGDPPISRAADTVASPSFAIPNHAILLAEDQPINRELLVLQFKALGVHLLDVTTNGVEALRAYEERAHALVITDCAMPEMDGQELIQRIRAGEAANGRCTYLIVLTANVMEHQRRHYLDLGANEVWVKPITVDQLRSVLEQMFGPAAVVPPTAGLPDGISAEEWPRLRDRVTVDLKKELARAHEAIDRQDWKRAWAAVHAILGIAKWFHFSDIAASALTIQMALDEGRTQDVATKTLEDAIAALGAKNIEI